jgi:hypothetical protein
MHEYLRTEAHDLRTSMNKLCISKLLQVIEQDLIPAERSSGTPSRNKPIQQPTTAAASTGHTSHTSPFASQQPAFKSASGF